MVPGDSSCVLNMLDFVLKMMDLSDHVLKASNFVLKMLDFVLKMMDFAIDFPPERPEFHLLRGDRRILI